VLRRLMEASQSLKNVDEKDVGFRLGPRINAVGRLEHADQVIAAFVGDDPEQLIKYMDECNEKRKRIQRTIVDAARIEAHRYPDAPILFLGGDWHPGVVGIAASKIAEEFWRPVWLFQRKDGVCKGSARSIAGFDVTRAMVEHGTLFSKFGGHAAAGGFTIPAAREGELRDALKAYAARLRDEQPELWQSRISYDCELPKAMTSLALADQLEALKPFGHGFEEPKFKVEAEIASVRFFHDKETGEPRHTCVMIRGAAGAPEKVMFFNEAHRELEGAKRASFVVSASRSSFRGQTSLMLFGHDFDLAP
jgi:single-stranded-DNA-specific exonuclease